MKIYALLLGVMATAILVLFGLVEALELPLLTDPSAWLGTRSWMSALVGIGLLIADVVIPVPASLVMVAHGMLFGVMWGTLLSLAGSVGAGMVGFGLGRLGHPLLERLVPFAERHRADALLARWGVLAVIVTRPVPILAECMAILAGTSRLSWPQMLVATAVGTLPAALLYALAGAVLPAADQSLLIFGLVLLMASITWYIGRRW